VAERRWTWEHLLVLVFAAGLVLFTLYRVTEVRRGGEAHHLGPISGSAAQSSAAGARIELDARISGYSLAAKASNDWSMWGTLAEAQLARARLTGNYADYGAAARSLDESFARAAKGSGPLQLKAGLGLAVHRLADAEAALNTIDHYALADPPGQRAEQRAMRGDIALYRGDYAGARQLYGAAATLGGGPSASCRIGNLDSLMGQYDAALVQFDRCEASVPVRTPQFAANVEMSRGAVELARGNWEGAAAHFGRADSLFPGHWLTAMRLAQVQALRGDPKGAMAAFTRIATETGNPEPMDVLAGLNRAAGDAVQSRTWAARAEAIWQQRVTLLPEASYAHALEHELAFGNSKRALAYAARNVKARPYGDAYIALARAWIANGRPDFGAAIGAKVKRSGWDSVQLHLMLTDAYALLGRGSDAEDERSAATALNRHALETNSAFAWLDH
jgi:hypothetical protein